MIRYELLGRFGHVVSVRLDVSAPDHLAPLTIDGREVAANDVREDVIHATTVDSRVLGEFTTGRDLHYAMRNNGSLQQYEPKLVEGHEMLGVDRDGELTQ